jgi:hypothetical protein
MEVRDLIKWLLDAPMDAEVEIDWHPDDGEDPVWASILRVDYGAPPDKEHVLVVAGEIVMG